VQERSSSSAVLGIATFNGLLALLSLATSALAARLLGPEGRGQLAQAQVVPSLIGSFALIGMSEAIIYHASKETAKPSAWIATGTLVSLATTATAWLIFVGVVLALPLENRRLMLTYAPMIVLMAAVTVPHSSLRARLKFATWNYLRPVPPLIWLTALCAGFVLDKPDVPFLIAIQLILLAIYAAVQYLVVMRSIPGEYRFEPRFVRPLVGFGLVVLAAQLPQMLAVRIDQIVVTAVLPDEKIGHYFVALGWSAIPTLFLQAISQVIFPRVAGMTSIEAQRNAIGRVSRLSAWLAMGIAVVVVAITPFAVPAIFGPAFREASSLAMILIVAASARGVAGVLQESARGLGRVNLILRSEVLGLVLLALTLWPLTVTFSAFGVAIASLISAVAAMLFILAGLAREVNLPMKSMLALTEDDIVTAWKRLIRKEREGPK
jgi:O-antigen/teichoic acid export membrane protein